MAFVNTYDRWEAAHAFINTWLKDQSKYCNNCGADYFPDLPYCCEKPQVGRNVDHTVGLIKQNAELRKMSRNVHASNETKTMRWGVSLPPRLFQALNSYFQQHLGHKLFAEKKDLREFAKRFKAFSIPERI